MQTHVARLSLADFRNYASLVLDFSPGAVVLTGENGAGKTNLLEAISFLSPGRGLRRAVLEDVARWLELEQLRASDRYQRGSLEIAVLPFMTQHQYDMLLWCCDFNAVRGEESFIRAQWAGRPLVWHIYPQEEDAHWDKLNAFLELYLRGLTPAASDALRGFWRAWNSGEGSGEAWSTMLEHEAQLLAHAEHWTRKQVANGDLAGKLVFFYADWLGATPA